MDKFEIKLTEIAEIYVGYQARGRIEENLDGNHVIIRSQDFNDAGDLCLNEAMRFSPTIDPDRYLVEAGDILVQARGQIHFAYLFEDKVNNTVASNSFYIVRVQEQKRTIPAYLAWWLNSPKVQAYFQKARGVSTIPFISKAVLQNTSIRVPPIETQERIGKLRQLWQKEQELNMQLIEKKESLIQEVCRRASIT